MKTRQPAAPGPRKGDHIMSDHKAYIKDLETRQREMEYKIGILLKRAGMGDDRREQREHAEGLGDLKNKMRLLEEKVEELRQAKDTWKNLEEGAEKAYQDVRETLEKVSGGIVK